MFLLEKIGVQIKTYVSEPKKTNESNPEQFNHLKLTFSMNVFSISESYDVV